MNNIGPSHFTVAPMWPKSYHTTGPKGTFLRHLVRHRTLSKTLGYMCFKDLQTYREYFVSVSMHCTVDGDPQDLFMKGINP